MIGMFRCEPWGTLKLYGIGSKEFEKYHIELGNALKDLCSRGKILRIGEDENDLSIFQTYRVETKTETDRKLKFSLSSAKNKIDVYFKKHPLLRGGLKWGLFSLGAAALLSGLVPVVNSTSNYEAYAISDGCSLIADSVRECTDPLMFSEFGKKCKDSNYYFLKKTVVVSDKGIEKFLEKGIDIVGKCTIIDNNSPSLSNPNVFLYYPEYSDKIFVEAFDDVGVASVKINGTEMERHSGSNLYFVNLDETKSGAFIEVEDFAGNKTGYNLWLEDDSYITTERIWKSGNVASNGKGGYVKYISKSLDYKIKATLEPVA